MSCVVLHRIEAAVAANVGKKFHETFIYLPRSSYYILVRAAAFKRRRCDYANLLVSMESIAIYLRTYSLCTYRMAGEYCSIKVVAVVILSRLSVGMCQSSHDSTS